MGDNEDDADQFERAINDFSQIGEGFKDTYTTGRVFMDKTNN